MHHSPVRTFPKVAAFALALLLLSLAPLAPATASGHEAEGQPDLVISGVTLSDPAPVPGQTVTVTVGIENVGDADATGTFFLRGHSQDYGFWMSHWFSDLSAGENATAQMSWTPYEGIHGLRFTIDYYDWIIESNETNNDHLFEVSVGDPKPDLTLFGPLVVPAEVLHGDLEEPWATTIREGDDMVLFAVIENEGTAPAGAVRVQTYLDDVLFDEQVLESDCSYCWYEDFVLILNWTATLGDHTFRVVADPLDEIDEKDETDNEGALDLDVISQDAPVPDLAVIDVTFPEDAHIGEWVTIEATIQNTGDADSPAFDAVLGAHRLGQSTVRFPSLAVDETVTISLSGSLPRSGYYWEQGLPIGVVVDPYIDWESGTIGDEVPEDNETNNYFSGILPVLLPDFAITDVRLPDGKYRPGDTAEMEVVITNEGEAWSLDSARLQVEVQGDEQTVTVPTLAPGEVTVVTVAITVVGSGGGWLYLRVNPDAEVAEADFSDNLWYDSYAFAASPGIVRFQSSANDGIVWSGERAVFQADIVNHGNLIDDHLIAEWYVDGRYRETQELIDWDGDGNVSAVFSWRPLDDIQSGQIQYGPHTVAVYLYPSLSDDDWDDNRAEETVYVKLTPLPPWI